MTARVWLKTEDVAARFGVGKSAVWGWRKRGLIKGVKFGRGWFFAVEEVERFEKAAAEAS